MKTPFNPQNGYASERDAPFLEEWFDELLDMSERMSKHGAVADPEYIDGYFAALIAGPRLVTPSIWLPHIIDDSATQALSGGEFERLMQLLTFRWNMIAWSVNYESEDPDDDTYLYTPWLAIPDPDVLVGFEGASWSTGFLAPESLWPEDWRLDKPEIDAVMTPLLDPYVQLAQMPDITPDMPTEQVRKLFKLKGKKREKLLMEAMENVYVIRDYYCYDAPPLRKEPLKVIQKPGRNDPCWCGSGKKYKFCHGDPTQQH